MPFFTPRITSLHKYSLVVFDLDGTLAPSKSAMSEEMAMLLMKLIKIKKVAVISGGNFHQFETQFLKGLPPYGEHLSNLILEPTSGTRMLTWKGAWHLEYAENFSQEEKNKIHQALSESMKQGGYNEPKVFGAVVEDRDSQVTFSGLGQNAPLHLKEKWDPNRTKRQKIVNFLEKKLPEFDIRMGGATSIDITRKGVNKAYGIRKLEEKLKIGPEEIVFVGDALFPGGNDYTARSTGVDCIQVAGPEETAKYIRSWTKESKTSA